VREEQNNAPFGSDQNEEKVVAASFASRREQRNYLRLQNLTEISEYAQRHTSLLSLCRFVARKVGEILSLDALLISLYHEQAATVEYIYALVDSKERKLTRPMNLHKLATVRVRQMILSGRPQRENNWRVEDEHEYTVVSLGNTPPRVRTLCDIPVMVDGRVLGGLHAQSYHPNAWDEDEYEYLEVVCGLLCGPMLYSRFEHENQLAVNRREAVETINELLVGELPLEQIILRIAKTLGDLSKATCTIYLSVEGDGQPSLRLAALYNRDPVVQLIQSDYIINHLDEITDRLRAHLLTPLLLEHLNLNQQPGSLSAEEGACAIMPLRVRGQSFGLIELTTFRAENTIQLGDLATMNAAASRLALLIENERLNAVQTRQRG